MTPNNTVALPEEIKAAIEKKYTQWDNMFMASREGAEFGYRLAIDQLAERDREIQRVKSLLKEVCVRANIIFPEEPEEIEIFEDQFKDQHDLLINIGATLGLGEIDEESKIKNQKQLKIIQQQWNQK